MPAEFPRRPLLGNRVNKEATPRAERSPPSTTRCLLVRPEGLSQHLGQRSEDPLRGFFAGDVMRTVCQGRVVVRAVPRGDVAVGLYYHCGVKVGTIVDGGIVPGLVPVSAVYSRAA